MTRKINADDGDQYLSAVLQLYRQLPETTHRISANDRQCAATLQARGIALQTVESALLLASLRRLARAADMPPLSPIRSLAYFLPVIEEVLAQPIPDDYLVYLRRKVSSLACRAQIRKCG